MRSAQGLIKVVDFGIAREPTATSTQTTAGTLIGTPAYMSPEQCRGQSADARCDLYALACTFYQLLTGRLPFAGQDPTATMYQHCHEPFPDATALVPGLPAEVLQILDRGSRKDPAERYASAVEFLTDVKPVLYLPDTPRESPAPEAPAGNSTKIRGPGAAAAAVAVSGANGGNGTDAAPGHDPATKPAVGPRRERALVQILKGKGLMGKLAYSLAAATLLGSVLYLGTRHADSAVGAGRGGPTAAQQDKAEATIRRVLAGEFADRSAAGRKALSHTLLQQGRQTHDDAALRYVCLRDARDLAGGAGDWPTAFEAADDLAAEFGVEPLDQKATALAATLPQLSTPAANEAVVEPGLALLALAVAADNYPVASRLSALVDTAAAKSQQLPLVARVQSRTRDVAGLRRDYDRFREAEGVLKQNPNDPEANAAAGRWLCLVKGDWANGLPLLAKGADKPLKDLAAAELGKPAGAAAVVKLADGWWDAAEGLAESQKANLRGHAASLYAAAAALPQASAAERARRGRAAGGGPTVARPSAPTAGSQPDTPPAAAPTDLALARR